MSGKTHAIIGANAIWLVMLAGMIDSQAPLLVLVGAVAGLLPDIDAVTAKIHYLGGGVLGVFKGWFQHRGFFHSILATTLLFLISLPLTRFHPMLPIVITAGYASHLLIDGFNFAGTRYLYPRRKMYHLVPKWMASPVGGFTDQLLFVIGLLGLGFFALVFYL